MTIPVGPKKWLHSDLRSRVAEAQHQLELASENATMQRLTEINVRQASSLLGIFRLHTGTHTCPVEHGAVVRWGAHEMCPTVIQLLMMSQHRPGFKLRWIER